MSRIDELKQQIAQLDELKRSGVLTTEAARNARERLQAELLTAVIQPSGAAAATTDPSAQEARPSGRLFLGIAVVVLSVAAGGYAWLGNQAGLSVEPGASGSSAASGSPHSTDAAQIEAMINGLKERLKTKPDDAEGWTILGRSYSALGRQAEALSAYRKVIELNPKDAQGYADLADALGSENGNSLEGEPEKLLAKALTLNPDNIKALALSGTVAFNRGDAATAAKQWERALRSVEPGSEMARQLQGAVNDAHQQLGAAQPPLAALSAPPPTAEPMRATTGAGATIQGRVTLSEKLKSKTSPEDTVFVFARALEPGKPPLAILRKQVKDLPFDFSLDDSMAMSPAMSLSTVKEAKVGARVSKSGNAMTQPGDLQGLTATVAVGAKGIKVEINEAKP